MEDSPIIELVDVRKKFGGQVVHDGVSLRVERGRTTVIIGSSGVGKSVLLKFILGLLRPDSGKVLVDGRDVQAMGRRELRRMRARLGVLFQGAALFDSLTVFENVALPLREKTRLPEETIREQVMEKLDMMGIANSAQKYPAEISGGMQKRVGLARALQMRPEIMLFDEPTTGLDPDTTNNIYRLFKDIQQKIGYAALIVSHDVPKVFNIADTVAILQDGKIQITIAPSLMRASDNPWVRKTLSYDEGW